MEANIKKILENAKTIAVIGASRDLNKDSYKVIKYLHESGYQILPINSKTDNNFFYGNKYHKKLNEIKVKIDILNIFRPSSEILEITKQILNTNIQTLWLQLGIFNSESKNVLKNKKINFIQNKCIKIKHQKLFN